MRLPIKQFVFFFIGSPESRFCGVEVNTLNTSVWFPVGATSKTIIC